MTRARPQEDRKWAQREILFPQGLVGLPGLRRWILVDMDPPLPMKWLQSLDREGFRLPVIDPGYYVEEYAFSVDGPSQQLLATDDVDDLLVMVISTITSGGNSVTGNLSAPLIVNYRNRRGVQMILTDGDYPLRQEIDQGRFGAAVAACLAGERPATASDVLAPAKSDAGELIAAP